ncbi:hypothetical protein QUB80_05690 [Chlorogloeopsis sp. ULAP01]|uniref:hypothetical protein n=1 Tax=Chlorogloeopsis sp. ULAP01 TaxID=3056483 RepID=UPI0025AA95B8|nr:hypothetical protein [Chlorogloeopsis sp. ULAP01]MDM9380192.1 hypothetical protein [Chlorogloeopsis sp. ULAP01]
MPETLTFAELLPMDTPLCVYSSTPVIYARVALFDVPLVAKRHAYAISAAMPAELYANGSRHLDRRSWAFRGVSSRSDFSLQCWFTTVLAPPLQAFLIPNPSFFAYEF